MPRKNPHAVALGKLSSKRKNVASAANGRRSKGRPAVYRVLDGAPRSNALALQRREGLAWDTPQRLRPADLAFLARWFVARWPEAYITRIDGGTVYYDPA